MAPVSSHTCSREMRSSLNSNTWKIPKVTRRPLPGMPNISPITLPVMDCSRNIVSSRNQRRIGTSSSVRKLAVRKP
jgi:hypothetical protein